MARRNFSNQSLHDRVIDVAVNRLTSWKTYQNPGQEKNAHIGTAYPDIILTNITSEVIEFIIEVETTDSITAHEAANQWSSYAKLSGTFYLLVPRESREDAEFLCTKYGVNVKFATYWLDSFNRIQLNYE